MSTESTNEHPALRPTLMGTLIQWCAQNEVEPKLGREDDDEPAIYFDHMESTFAILIREDGGWTYWASFRGDTSIGKLDSPTCLLSLLNRLLPEQGNESEGRE